MSPLAVQTGASLLAIFALAGLAWWLKLGGDPRLENEFGVRRAAGEVEDGFAPACIACDADGVGALARDAGGRIMLIKRHGNRFAGRVLGPNARARLEETPDGHRLVVDPGEARFGTVALAIPDPQAWADAIDGVRGRQDA
ncbi:hypothetical protein [Erythrobacter sp. WG]|uniref:hypothetical protein n=1 Tax=Erythrobacter sp. WG TaxID=2985510 RepID=UPI002271E5AC|nr:hypothetical protein [Erythrobacter sp. WG]MCX9145847.1 hypothetical protein [Erythrobacter sp. WG]